MWFWQKALLLLSYILHSKGYEIETEVLSNSGVIFESLPDVVLTNSQWTLVLKYDFSSYRDDIIHLQHLVENLTRDYSDISMEYPNFKLEFEKIQSSIEEFLSSSNQLLTLFPNDRQKRGVLNVVGHALSYLFGVVTDDQLEAIAVQLDQMRDSDDAIVHNTNDQLTIMKAVENQIETNSKRLQTVVNTFINLTDSFSVAFNQSLMNLQEEGRTVKKYFYLSTHFRQIELILSDARFYLVSLYDTLQSTSNMKLSHNLLPPAQLLSMLLNISAILPSDFKFMTAPSFGNLYLFYQSAKVVSAVDNSDLIYFVSFPIHSPQSIFRAYLPHTFPVYLPSIRMWMSLDLQEEVLLLSKDGEYYHIMAKNEYTECHSSNSRYCLKSRVLLHRTHSSCLLNLYHNSTTGCTRKTHIPSLIPYVATLDNSILVSTKEVVTLSFSCNKTLVQMEVKDLAIFKNIANCTISTPDWKILPSVSGNTHFHSFHRHLQFPSLNFSFITNSELDLFQLDLDFTHEILNGLRESVTGNTTDVSVPTLINALKERYDRLGYQRRMAFATAGGGGSLMTLAILGLLYYCLCCSRRRIEKVATQHTINLSPTST